MITFTLQPLRCLQFAFTLLGLAAGAANAGDEHLVGRWDGPFDWPVVAVHAALLPDGKVLAYDSVGDDAAETYPDSMTATRATVWTPNAITELDQSGTHDAGTTALGYNLFCSGLALLPNGQLFFAGGNKNSPRPISGINRLTNFNPYANSLRGGFSAVGSMATERWYPSITGLANGEMLITGGVDAASAPEVRQVNGTLRQLTGATDGYASERLYNWTKLAPNGKVAYLGPRRDLRHLVTDGAGRWETAGNRDELMRDYGSHAVYADGKALVAGGGYTATDSAVIVDLNTLSATPTEPMRHPRRQHNLTVLADGTVLATGGFAGSRFDFDYANAENEAESWNPRTQTWTPLAAMRVHRGYHSIALLLPDGRVLSAGGGVCGGCLAGGYLQKNAEIYSPPYLFKRDGSGQLASRPRITSAPDELAPGQVFSIGTRNAGRIGMVALIKLGSATHSVNMEQRFISLKYSLKSPNLVRARAPADNNIAPPGHYMLVICRKLGIPSIAKIVRITGNQAISFAQ